MSSRSTEPRRILRLRLRETRSKLHHPSASDHHHYKKDNAFSGVPATVDYDDPENDDNDKANHHHYQENHNDNQNHYYHNTKADDASNATSVPSGTTEPGRILRIRLREARPKLHHSSASNYNHNYPEDNSFSGISATVDDDDPENDDHNSPNHHHDAAHNHNNPSNNDDHPPTNNHRAEVRLLADQPGR